MQGVRVAVRSQAVVAVVLQWEVCSQDKEFSILEEEVGEMKFRKKPVVVDAIQWDGKNRDEMRAFIGQSFGYVYDRLEIYTSLAERVYASPGDWVIRGVKGEYYPCKPDIFIETYEPVKE